MGEDLIALRGEFRASFIDLRKDFDSVSRAVLGRLDKLNGSVAQARHDIDEHEIRHIREKAAADIEAAHEEGVKEGRAAITKRDLAILGGAWTVLFTLITIAIKVLL